MIKKFTVPNTVFAALVLFLVVMVFSGGVQFIMTYDIFAHYIYLPLVFDQHSVLLTDMGYPEALNQQYNISPVLYQFCLSESGHYFTKCTYGWSLLQLPFYLIAELWAWLGAYPTDGFSQPYRVMMFTGAVFYAMLGLYFVKRILEHFFKPQLAVALLLLLVFGTNLFFIELSSVGSSNYFAFTLVAFLIFRILRFYDQPGLKNALLTAVAWGLLTLVRPPTGIFGLLIFLWPLAGPGNFMQKVKAAWSTYRKEYVVIGAVFFVMLIPQMTYWYLSTGSFIMNSYANNAGEGFDFLHPHTLPFLFSFRNGWLIYTPLMLFALAGGWWMLRRHEKGWLMVIVVLLFLYIASSWTTWWYGSCLGQRAMVDAYPVLIVFLGFAGMAIAGTKFKWPAAVLVLFFVFLNLFQTWQIANLITTSNRMTMEYYFATFLQVSRPTPQQHRLLAVDRDYLHKHGFRNGLGYERRVVMKEVFLPQLLVTPESKYAPEFYVNTGRVIRKSHAWIKITWQLEKAEHLDDMIFYVAVLHRKKNYGWQGFEAGQAGVETDSLKRTISFAYLTPPFRHRDDDINIGAYSKTDQPVYIISRQVEIFEPLLDYR